MEKLADIFLKHMEGLRDEMFRKLATSYNGNHPTILSAETKKKFEIKVSAIGATFTVPAWFPVFETGRGPRKTSQNQNFYLVLFYWGRRHDVWKSTDVNKQLIEAKQMAWYINKYGSKLFRQKAFRDIYTTEIPKTIEKIMTDIQQTWLKDFEFQIKTELYKAG